LQDKILITHAHYTGSRSEVKPTWPTRCANWLRSAGIS